MGNITTIGLDLAKTTFHVHATDARGNKVKSKKITRSKLVEFFSQLPTCLIGMEACSGAHYWAKKLQSLGHEVKLISPQFIKPYVKSNKNDWKDAEAIAEAVTRPSMRFVPIKNVEQLDIQIVHRRRQLLVQQRTALSNQVRGLLAEYGIVIGKGLGVLRKYLAELEGQSHNEQELTHSAKRVFVEMYTHLKELDEKITHYDNELERFARSDEKCQKLMAIEGIGPKTATILVATVSDTTLFKNGRELAAWFGLVPKQHSTGGKERLLGISKRGDRYIRCLLVHGARSALRSWTIKPPLTRRAQWALSKSIEIGSNKASVALANKMARTVWAILAKEVDYKPNGLDGQSLCQ